MALITRRVERVKASASALYGPILFCTDGLRHSVSALRDVFRESLPSGERGRPEKRPWQEILIAQVIKQSEQGPVVGVLRRLVHGTAALIISDSSNRNEGSLTPTTPGTYVPLGGPDNGPGQSTNPGKIR